MSAAADIARTPRGKLFRKYALLCILLVAVALIVNSAVDFWFSYEESKAALVSVQQEKADAAAQRIEGFIGEIERQIGWTTHAQWAAGSLDQRRFDFVRLLRQVPAITEIAELDGAGLEQLRVSRLSMDVVGSGKDLSSTPAFTEARAHGVWFSPVYFRKESEPYMTLAMARAGRNAGVTVAEINLKLIWDVITALRIGQGGYAYVVDRRGRLIAHPDLSLVLRDTDFSRLAQVAAALAPDGGGGAAEADSFAGRPVLTAHATIAPLGWIVFVEVPLAEAFAPLYGTAWRSGVVLAGALVVAALAALGLARRMTGPIRALQEGAARIGAGELDRRLDIRTGDELEGLAGQFNRMAADLQASYAELEGKVAARTAELSEALEQQTATADVLQVINASPGDLAPVFDAMLERATRLCDAAYGVLWMYDGEGFRVAAERGVPPLFSAFLAANPDRPIPGIGLSPAHQRILDGEDVVQFDDVAAEEGGESKHPLRRGTVALGGARTLVCVALRNDERVLGHFTIFRQEVRPFADKQIALVQNFAAQAVIAIENARLLGELQTRTGELAERNSAYSEQVEYQGATIDILKVMSASTSDTQPVFDIILRRAMQLCNCEFGHIAEMEGELLYLRASFGWSPELMEAYRGQYPMRPTREFAFQRSILDGEIVLIRNADETPVFHESARRLGHKSQLSVPLMRDGVAIGTIAVASLAYDAFSDAQIELLKTFAEQAVIAIGSVATFRALQDRTAELSRSVAELQALEEVLRAVNASLDLETVLSTIIERAVPLVQADEGMIYEFDSDEEVFVPKAAIGMSEERIATLRERRIRIGETYLGRSALLRTPVHLEDVQRDSSIADIGDAMQGVHAVLAVPLLREADVVGALVIRRRTEGAFTPATVALMQTFAAQCVLAIENARLFDAASRARAASEATLADLRAAQDRLVQSEKMASLGQLTAGIAHEIKNPLNFVSNFSSLSTELIAELLDLLGPAPLDAAARAEIEEITGMLKGNLEKVVQHAKRADGIVRNMLLHSREGGGERRSVDLNATVDEALNLAYHGARAETPGFNIALERHYDPQAGELELYPQEFTRVLLNLFSNGFYAATHRPDAGEGGFQPTLSVTTEARPREVVIRVRDNGAGIPDTVKARMFEPFFTTKPAGEGTGLGLSLSHDIVVKQHGGSIAVDSAPGAFTEFTIRLPRTRPAAKASAA